MCALRRHRTHSQRRTTYVNVKYKYFHYTILPFVQHEPQSSRCKFYSEIVKVRYVRTCLVNRRTLESKRYTFYSDWSNETEEKSRRTPDCTSLYLFSWNSDKVYVPQWHDKIKNFNEKFKIVKNGRLYSLVSESEINWSLNDVFPFVFMSVLPKGFLLGDIICD